MAERLTGCGQSNGALYVCDLVTEGREEGEQRTEGREEGSRWFFTCTWSSGKEDSEFEVKLSQRNRANRIHFRKIILPKQSQNTKHKDLIGDLHQTTKPGKVPECGGEHL